MICSHLASEREQSAGGTYQTNHPQQQSVATFIRSRLQTEDTLKRKSRARVASGPILRSCAEGPSLNVLVCGISRAAFPVGFEVVEVDEDWVVAALIVGLETECLSVDFVCAMLLFCLPGLPGMCVEKFKTSNWMKKFACRGPTVHSLRIPLEAGFVLIFDDHLGEGRRNHN